VCKAGRFISAEKIEGENENKRGVESIRPANWLISAFVVVVLAAGAAGSGAAAAAAAPAAAAAAAAADSAAVAVVVASTSQFFAAKSSEKLCSLAPWAKFTVDVQCVCRLRSAQAAVAASFVWRIALPTSCGRLSSLGVRWLVSCAGYNAAARGCASSVGTQA